MSAVDGPTLLSARQLVFSYPRRHVFSGWSAEFKSGLTWVRGINGSGKSTLLHLLAGALPLQGGVLQVHGIDSTTHALAYRLEVFYCGPGPIAFDHLRPTEFFGFMRALYPRFDVDALGEHVRSFGLEGHLDLRLSALSTGTQRKVWLAAALVAGTRVVLLDEPGNSLDVESLDHLKSQLLRRAYDKGRACIVTSHESLGEAGEGVTCVDLPPPQP